MWFAWLIFLWKALAACTLISQMVALGLLVAAALRGNLDLCRVGIITCKTHTSILENVEKPCCMLSGGGQGPLPLWGPYATSCCQVCVWIVFGNYKWPWLAVTGQMSEEEQSLHTL